MKGYATISNEEKNSILQQHSSFYDGYTTGNVPSGPQRLRQDPGPSDTGGVTINNRGEVGQYKNHRVNETTISSTERNLRTQMSPELEQDLNAFHNLDINEKDDKWIQDIDMKEGSFTKYCGGNVTCECVAKAQKEGGKPAKQAQLYLNMNSDKCSSLQESTADDMDVSDVDAAYDYDSGGPEQFDDSYSDESMSLDIDSIMKMFGGDMSAADYGDMEDMMNSDLDGKEKDSGEMRAYNFDSEGGDVGVYSEEEGCDECGETDESLVSVMPMDKPTDKIYSLKGNDQNYEVQEGYGETCESCGGEKHEGECSSMYEDVDEDLRESLIKDKERITEMFDRFKKYL